MKAIIIFGLIALYFCSVVICDHRNDCYRVFGYKKSVSNPPTFPQLQSVDPPALDETWLSTSCETIPAGNDNSGRPRYQFRKYVFEGTSFGSIIHYYEDPECAIPYLSANYGGNLIFADISEVNSGGWNYNLEYTRGELTPHSHDAVDFLNSAESNTCGQTSDGLGSTWSQGVTKRIDTTGGCSVLDISVNPGTDYQLFRVFIQKHKYGSELNKENGLKTNLQFGQYPSDGSNIQIPQKRPFAFFEDWLVPSDECSKSDDEDDEITICKAILDSTAQTPPTGVSVQYKTPPYFMSTWGSQGCESVTTPFGGLYLARKIVFDTSTIESIFWYYIEPTCNIPAYTVRMKGTYGNQGASSVLQHTWNMEYHFTSAYVTAVGPSWKQLFSVQPVGTCGIAEEWEEKVEQDVTSTNGCQIINVQVNSLIPETYYDVMQTRDEYSFLYLGQLTTDLSYPNTESQRATAFQTGLIEEYECDRVNSATTSLMISTLLIIIGIVCVFTF